MTKFKYEDCLLKHYVRTNVWLPAARKRRDALKQKPAKMQRRIKYFTFCAVGALDVLTLELHKVLTLSSQKRRDTVVFFDRDAESVTETQKRIPGAIGFGGDFVEVVLTVDAPVDYAAEPQNEEDTRANRHIETVRAQRKNFSDCFPFDVINLDLEEFFFKTNDPFPGKLLKALKFIFEWQKRPLRLRNGLSDSISSFTLFFTTQIGPPSMSADYRTMLRDCLRQNFARDQALRTDLESLVGHQDVDRLEREEFGIFFKLAVPKIIALALNDSAWYVEGQDGIEVFEFERRSTTGSYSILHLAFEIKRKDPPSDSRAPGVDDPNAATAYAQAVRSLFQTPATLLQNDSIDNNGLRTSLKKVLDYRKRICPDD